MPRGFKLVSRLLVGVSRPRQRVLGTGLAGVVEATGSAVTRFEPGDEVFAACGVGMGAHAEYRCVSEHGPVARKPRALDFGEAAALTFGGGTALLFLRRGAVKAGERVLVNGASGAVGSAMVQLARQLGAHVTAVCSGANFALVEALGAEVVIDYTQQDFTLNGQTYDVIADVAGTAPHARCRASLTPTGRLLLVLGELPSKLNTTWVRLTTRQRVIAGPAEPSPDDVRELAALAESGAFKPVIGARFGLEQIVEAHRLVDTGHKRGSVVVTL
jgi:NADPH:quinone reductase-like Zn-dependent oxidoreductase